MNILGLPQSGVFVITDIETSRVYVNYTQNLFLSLARLMEELGGEILARLQLRVVEVTTDLESMKLFCEYHRDKYRNMGWTELLPHGRKALQYRARLAPSEDLKRWEVRLVTARGDSSKVVGVFKNKGEAQTFIETCYKGDLCLPVYALNSDTKELLEKANNELKIK